MPITRLGAGVAAAALTVAAASTVAAQAGTQASGVSGTLEQARATAFTVTAKLSDTSVLRNERVVLSGTVKPVRTAREVLIQQSTDAGWATIAQRTMKDDGSYRYAFTPEIPGQFTYRARMPRVGQVGAGKSPELTLTVAQESLVVFRIKPGTSFHDWNTAGSTVTAQVGDTLRIVNADSMSHRPHTDGAPFPAPATSIPPGGKADYVLESAYDSNEEHTLYCAVHGPTSQFWLDVVEPD